MHMPQAALDQRSAHYWEAGQSCWTAYGIDTYLQGRTRARPTLRVPLPFPAVPPCELGQRRFAMREIVGLLLQRPLTWRSHFGNSHHQIRLGHSFGSA
jgi:hypothetical protein